jgi:hypothetical protein
MWLDLLGLLFCAFAMDAITAVQSPSALISHQFVADGLFVTHRLVYSQPHARMCLSEHIACSSRHYRVSGPTA